MIPIHEQKSVSRRCVLGIFLAATAGCGNRTPAVIDPDKAKAAMQKRRPDYGDPPAKSQSAKNGR